MRAYYPWFAIHIEASRLHYAVVAAINTRRTRQKAQISSKAVHKHWFVINVAWG